MSDLSTPGRAPSFTGAWQTTFGRLTAEHGGDVVEGRYNHMGGTIRGEVSGNTLRGEWSEPEHGKAGTMELTLDPSGNSFRGTWTHTRGGAGGGEWAGARLDLPSAEEGGFPGGWNSHASGPLLAGPMLGEAGPTDARVWVQARDTSPLTLVVTRSDGTEIAIDADPAWDEWLCVTFLVEGLRPEERAAYEIRSRNGRTARHHLRAGKPRHARRLKLAFGSCYWNYPNHKLTIFDAIGRDGPDLFMLIGDTSYMGELDWHSEHTMMLTHLRHRNNEALRRLVADIPVIGAWDDHDFGPNDADSTFSGADIAASAFKRCWANAAYGTSDLPGVFGAARVGPAEIFWIDTRTYRIDGKCLLGEAQLDWLLQRLARSDAPVKIVASATQVLPQFPVKHKWASFRGDAPAELERMVTFIEENDVQGVVFISGDLHMSDLIHVPGRARPGGGRGPELWELTSSPLANDPWKEPQIGTDPYLIKEVADRTTYGLVDVDLDRPGREISLILRDERGSTFFEALVPLPELRVR